MTPTPAASCLETKPSGATPPLDVQAEREVEQWRSTLIWDRLLARPACPLLTEMGSLPDGWDSVSLLTLPDVRFTLALVRRSLGGWLLVVHQGNTMTTSVAASSPTLAGLYETVAYMPTVMSASWLVKLHIDPVMEWLTNQVATLYDPQVPDEEAERVLVALTGRMRHFPLAATLPL